MKLNRTWAMVVAIVMALTLSLSGTLAYLQDTDEAVNVMTLGNVQIKQLEYQRAEGVAHDAAAQAGDLVPFVQGKPLYPAVPKAGEKNPYTAEKTALFSWGPYVTAAEAGNGLWNDSKIANVVDKFVFVKNTGKSDAYYRTLIAFECPDGMEYGQGSDKHFMMNVNGNVRFDWANHGYITVKGVRYLLMSATYNEILTPGEISRPSLLQVLMTEHCTNEHMELLGDSYEILVVTQAVQAAGFEDAETALNEAFGEITADNHPWVKEDALPTIVKNEGTSTVNTLLGSNNEVIINNASGTVDASTSVGVNGADITIIGGTVDAGTTGGFNKGIQHASTVEYNNATIKGSMSLYGDKVVFNSCTFDLTEISDYIWTYGAKEVEFNNCTFNTCGKAILVYNEGTVGSSVVTVKNCTFNATKSATASAVPNQACAAIEVDSSLIPGTYTINVEGTNTVDEDFSGIVRIKNDGGKNNVIVNGATPVALPA